MLGPPGPRVSGRKQLMLNFGLDPGTDLSRITRTGRQPVPSACPEKTSWETKGILETPESLHWPWHHLAEEINKGTRSLHCPTEVLP